MDAFAFEITLLPFRDLGPDELVLRTIALRGDQTLEQLHEAMRLTFGWADPHLYAFWRGARWWDDNAVRYDAPFAAEDLDAPTARVTLSEIGLRKGQRLAYVFDFGDEWRAFIRVAERWKVDEDDCYPTLVEAVGVPPPQYEEFEEE